LRAHIKLARTLNYLQEHGVDDYSVLAEKAAASAKFNGLPDKLNDLATRLDANAAL
jgi:hypothetical protein